MADTYLKRQKSGLYIYRRKTPVLLKERYGKEYIQHSLGTHSRHEAILKRNAINAEIELELARAKQGDNDKTKFYSYFTPWRKERMERENEVTSDNEPHPMEEADLEVIIEKPEDKTNPTVHAAWKAAMSGEIPDKFKPTLTEILQEWVEWAQDKKNAKYISTMETSVRALKAFLMRDDLPENVSSGMAQQFIDTLISTGKSSNTVTHYKSKLQELWRWALAREKASGNNPWVNTKVEASKKQVKKEHYRNFTNQELKRILERTQVEKLRSDTWPYPYSLHMLPRLLPFLGARLSELALAKKEQFVNVSGRLIFEIRDGKTKNAQRIVPVSPVIQPLVEEALQKAGSSPWLFPEVGEAKIGASKATNSISSKFRKLTKDFEKLEGFKTGLHSFRGHFATALEEVGCPEQLAAKLAGHKQLSLTYNLYSKYQNKDDLWKYIERIHEADCLKSLVLK